MGIIFSNALLLANARRSGVCFDRILTIGHLNQYLSRTQIQHLADRCGRAVDTSAIVNETYVDKLFEQLLDAKSVTSLDYSDFEQCDIVHDMNQPVDANHHEQFNVVIDGGSLEHIFHFPTAIANCMRMVKVGGSVFVFTMANNHMGHGFYQFSPELFFRVFQPENGFEIRNLILEQHSYPGVELSRTTRCYSVADPAVVQSRVGLVSRSPVMMMIHAVRTEANPIFSTYPIQSDYSSRYKGAAGETPRGNAFIGFLKNVARRCLKGLPPHCKNVIDGNRQLWQYSFANARFYKRWIPIEPTDVQRISGKMD